jgi:hypothetical protein
MKLFVRFFLPAILFLAILSPQIAFTEDIQNKIFLLERPDKLLAFSGLKNKWFERDLQPGETVVKSTYDGNVAIAYTNERALAFSGITGRWSEERFRIRETVQSISAEGNVGTIITNIRALGFSALKGVWVESHFKINN